MSQEIAGGVQGRTREYAPGITSQYDLAISASHSPLVPSVLTCRFAQPNDVAFVETLLLLPKKNAARPDFSGEAAWATVQQMVVVVVVGSAPSPGGGKFESNQRPGECPALERAEASPARTLPYISYI